jgi:hypothetical protein
MQWIATGPKISRSQQLQTECCALQDARNIEPFTSGNG